jgi:nucleoside-triphosphatase THEP1
MKLLLTGAPRTGKTTILRRLAQAYPGNSGGVLVTELTSAEGKRCGFELQVVWSAPGGRLQVLDRATLARDDQWSPLKAGRYAVSPEALDLAVRAIDAAMHEGGLVIIDEIGPLQATSAAFRDAVLRCLDCACHLIGTLSTSSDPFVEQVRTRPGVRLLEVTRANRLHLVEGLIPWLS